MGSLGTLSVNLDPKLQFSAWAQDSNGPLKSRNSVQAKYGRIWDRIYRFWITSLNSLRGCKDQKGP